MVSSLAYPQTVHVRRHGPGGYAEYQQYKPWLRDEFTFRCVYCLIREQMHREGQDLFGVEHLIPQTIELSLVCDYNNLLYACNRCNSIRGKRSGVLDPCRTAYGEHMQVLEDGKVDALSDPGRIQIEVLELNDPDLVADRYRFIQVVRKLQAPDCDAEWARIMEVWVRYPEDLPDLRTFRPPTNSKPESKEDCHYARREVGCLPRTY